ncbi:MAG: hypothetical protein A2X45_21215 [Lentisphaerae bacterium GWF2_50_93]|nr:MAG: hypothetical protein A2X45_21215 [Lentisphaerae bacterium GWF2_50_93]
MAKPVDIGKARKAEDVKAKLADAPKAHPRLFLKSGDEEKLKARIAGDPLLQGALDHVKDISDAMIAVPVLERKQIGRRLLDVSRTALRRITYLSLAYRMTKDRRYLERAQKEMLACAGFTDWNPRHFLDVAEMTTALAIGYDWLYQELEPEARRTIRTAIVEKGLKPGMKVNGGWVTGTNNWNQVCNGGLTIGVLAVLEDEPELAADIIVRAVAGVPNSMHEYVPDGAYPEGPTYWGYGTSYNVLMLAALESVLGSDFGLSGAKGFMDTPDFLINVTGPTRLFFNYSDCSINGGVEPAMYWFALKKDEPSLLVIEKERLKKYLAGKHGPEGMGNRFFPLLLLWAKPFAEMKPPSGLSWNAGGRTPLGIHRSGWDENATFVATKGGSPSSSHAHMDIGSFVMDADGVRWAEDLGMQGYESLESKGVELWNGKQDGGRWTVFRLNNRGHNTLVVDDKLQIAKGNAPITEFKKDGPFPHTVVNMTAVYEGQLKSAVRGIGLREDGSVLVQDELQAPDRKVNVRWGMITRAEVKITGDGAATLERDGKQLEFRVLSPSGVKLKIYNTEKPPREYDAENKGTCMIGFEVDVEKSAKERLSVWLAPVGKTGNAPELKPVGEWGR